MKKLIGLVLLLVLGFTGCKKGEDDPFISLRSRNNRLTGEWKMVSGEFNTTIKEDGTTRISKSVYSNGFYNETTTSSNGDNETTTYSGSIILEFEKEGTFTYTSNDEDYFSTMEGVWSFLNKNKELDLKNKEAIMLTFTSGFETYDGEMDRMNTLSGKTNIPEMIFIIKQLKNNEMVLVVDRQEISSNGEFELKDNFEITLEKK